MNYAECFHIPSSQEHPKKEIVPTFAPISEKPTDSRLIDPVNMTKILKPKYAISKTRLLGF